MVKHDYQIKFEITDEETGEVLASATSYLPNEKRSHSELGMEILDEESAEMEFWSLLHFFRNKAQPKYERDEAMDELIEQEEAISTL